MSKKNKQEEPKLIIDDKEYVSKANQALIFNNQIEHQGFTQTDTPIRIVLNIVTSKDIYRG